MLIDDIAIPFIGNESKDHPLDPNSVNGTGTCIMYLNLENDAISKDRWIGDLALCKARQQNHSPAVAIGTPA